MHRHRLLSATILTAAATLVATKASAQVVVVNSDINTSTTWTANNTYQLVGQIYVNPGASLTIQAGTVIASAPAQEGSLAVARGAQIFVNGTEDNPVIFTSTADVATWAPLASHPTGKNPKTGTWREIANEWGNLTLMGNGYIGACTAGNTTTPNPNNVAAMEGLVANPMFPSRNFYGGGNDDDDSGSISYLSLRYTGKVLGLNNELNGLALGGVGRNTDIHHVDIMNGVDDGIEIWGGTVNLKYINIWNIGDDSLDVDQGWRGKVQFGLIVQGFSASAAQGSGVGDNCIEADGAERSNHEPVTTSTLYNLTVIGQPGGDHGMALRDNVNLQVRNSIFMDLGETWIRNDNVDGDACGTGFGFSGTLSFAARWTTPAAVNPPFYTAQSSGTLLEASDNVLFNNTFATAYNTAISVGALAAGPASAMNNQLAATLPIQSITRGAVVFKGPLSLPMQQVLMLDPRPAGDALTSVAWAPQDGFFCQAHYRGAFAPGTNWLCDWTASAAYGFTPGNGAWCDLGKSSGGVTGSPILSATGTMGGGTTTTFALSNAAPLSLALFAMGFARLDLPAFGGTIVPNYLTFGTGVFVTDVNGNSGFSLNVPVGVLPAGTPFYVQAGVVENPATPTIAFSNAITKRAP
ncbi:MAG: hypothetical protein IPK26_16500 [Planctomycetes bacterium]|nr:hypothetical protein [Planctomycetota bacterium]